ncbi:MAG: SET domain-containing protein-lysine N-methyltransferase [Desulfobacteraceae bacterium]|nr:MAG: SET domain-containing protein-lysine N-methyltransferase [Desulfobacteraceae bacterium]
MSCGFFCSITKKSGIMLEIKTSLNTSPINGIGLFAEEDVQKGKIIWSFNPLVDIVFHSDQWDELQSNISKHSFDQIKKYAYKENNRRILCVDNAQFMNHSDTHYNVGNLKDGDIMIALTHIKKGEELLCNYFDYSDADDDHLKEIS